MPSRPDQPLAGVRVAITRPVGAGAALRARIRALGGDAFSLPGASLRAAQDSRAARAGLRAALASEVVIFTSPAAVRFAAHLQSLRTQAAIVVPGAGTAAALKRLGRKPAIVPPRADSEGMLALPLLQHVRGLTLGIIGAPNGRGLLEHELVARGARVVNAQVYRRVPARLDRRHVQALLGSRAPLYLPLSSREALLNLLSALPDAARGVLLAATVVASSGRLLDAARAAGFVHVLRAASASDTDLIGAIVAAHARR